MNAAAQQQTPNPPSIEGSASTCIVGCKLPHGLVLEIFNEQGISIEKHKVKGKNDSRIVGGYGITDGVPRKFMEEWFRRNAKHPAVVNELLFINTNKRDVVAQAKDNRERTTGLEAIDPLKDAGKHGIAVDKESEQAYRKQVAENPVRNRQIVE